MSDLPPHIDPKVRYRRYLTDRDLRPYPPKGHCKWCHRPIEEKRRKTWCSKACVDAYLVRASAQGLRHQIEKRDKGVCAQCGTDTKALLREWHAFLDEMDVRGPWIVVRPKSTDERRPKLLAFWASRGWPLRCAEKRKQTLWEADHILPVIGGGGCCGPENIRTLCIPCHKAETAALRKRLAGAGRTMTEELFET